MRRWKIGRFALHHATAIAFLTVALCIAGIYAAFHMPSSIFPETNFPRIIIMAENGVMPADEMMATVTKPIEEAMKDIPGSGKIRSSTGRGVAEIDIFFSWDTDMVQAELNVRGHFAQIREALPATATTSVHRMTFATFPIIGLSFTSPARDPTSLWEMAQYGLKPQLLRIPGVAKVDVTGGSPPEYHVLVDPLRLAELHLSLTQVTEALVRNNLLEPTGMLDQDQHWYLTVVDGRVHSIPDLENLTLPNGAGQLVRIGDFAAVSRGPEPAFEVVSADGVSAVLLSVYAQPNSSTLEIAKGVSARLAEIKESLPSDVQVKYFYDQSLFVHTSVDSVWEAIAFGLILSVVILYLFLRNWGTTLVAVVVIPVTVLFTILAMKLCGQSFNLMTLGGIAAAIGLIIDDAIVVVEAISVKMAAGSNRATAVREGIGEIFAPLLGSTLTPVVVFIPLAFLTGISGVFFRALAVTMVVGMLTSLFLALTLTPALAARLMPAPRRHSPENEVPSQPGGLILHQVVSIYEWIVRAALEYRWFTLALCVALLAAAGVLCRRLKTDFLPAMDEGGFVIDFVAPPGTSLSEANRQILQAQAILKNIPEVESFSCRIGAALGVHLVEPNTGDFLVKLKAHRRRGTEQVIADVRQRFNRALPDIDWNFPGILTDLIGDLISWSDSPVEIKLFSNDTGYLTDTAGDIEDAIGKIRGIVDTNSVVFTGPSISLQVRYADAQRFGLDARTIAANVRTAMLGEVAATVLEGDRVINIRVRDDPAAIDRIAKLRALPLRAADGTIILLEQVADLVELPPQCELERDDLRQMAVVSARLQDRDLGSAMRDIRKTLAANADFPSGMIEFGGLYEMQQDSFHSLLVVLIMAVVLVFAVAVIEFRSFIGPLAIVFGAVLALFGIILALVITGTSVSIVVYLGAIIGTGIVHKNGILMLDYVEHLQRQGTDLRQALIQAGRRRLRPVLMTSLTAALGMLPLAYGIGSGADMLRPMAIAIIGAVIMSVLLSLVATPTLYFVLVNVRNALRRP